MALEVLGQDFADVIKGKTTPFQWRGREDEEGAVRRYCEPRAAIHDISATNPLSRPAFFQKTRGGLHCQIVGLVRGKIARMLDRTPPLPDTKKRHWRPF